MGWILGNHAMLEAAQWLRQEALTRVCERENQFSNWDIQSENITHWLLKIKYWFIAINISTRHTKHRLMQHIKTIMIQMFFKLNAMEWDLYSLCKPKGAYIKIAQTNKRHTSKTWCIFIPMLIFQLEKFHVPDRFSQSRVNIKLKKKNKKK